MDTPQLVNGHNSQSLSVYKIGNYRIILDQYINIFLLAKLGRYTKATNYLLDLRLTISFNFFNISVAENLNSISL